MWHQNWTYLDFEIKQIKLNRGETYEERLFTICSEPSISETLSELEMLPTIR